MRRPASHCPLNPRTVLAAVLLLTCAAASSRTRCPSTGSDSLRLFIIDPLPYSTTTLPINITACVPPHLLRSAATASLLLTVNTAVIAASPALPAVSFPFHHASDSGIFSTASPFECCVYFVPHATDGRHLIGDYHCVITAASRAPPPPPALLVSPSPSFPPLRPCTRC
jgi:hypothetical protein